MLAQRESAMPSGETGTAPTKKVIRIIQHTPKMRKRKSRRHIIAVKAITFAAALVAIYGLMYMEQKTLAGLIIFAIPFSYLLIFAYANGGFR